MEVKTPTMEEKRKLGVCLEKTPHGNLFIEAHFPGRTYHIKVLPGDRLFYSVFEGDNNIDNGIGPTDSIIPAFNKNAVAGESLSPTESGPYTLDKDTKEHYGEEYFWRIFGPDVKGSGTVTRPCIAKVWDEQTAIRIVNFLNAEAPTEKPSQYVPFQTCPKCLGDGHLGRYNSPAYMATSVFPTCDVCHGSKIIAQSLVVDNPEPLSDVAIQDAAVLSTNDYHSFISGSKWARERLGGTEKG